MRNVLLLLPLSLFVFLTACQSIVGAIIGERPVTNLFGLNDREITFGLPGGQQPQGKVSPAQAAGILINVPLTDIPFSDIGDLSFPLGAVPKAASEKLGISPVIQVTSASSATAFPARLGLENSELDLTIRDGSGAPSVRQQLKAPENTTVNFSKTACDITEAGTVCGYVADKAQEELYFFTILLEGQDFDTLFNDILQAGDKTNNASGVVTLSVSTSLENLPPIPLDSSFKLTLETRNGKVRFF